MTAGKNGAFLPSSLSEVEPSPVIVGQGLGLPSWRVVPRCHAPFVAEDVKDAMRKSFIATDAVVNSLILGWVLFLCKS